jgi:hypothetical protein
MTSVLLGLAMLLFYESNPTIELSSIAEKAKKTKQGSSSQLPSIDEPFSELSHHAGASYQALLAAATVCFL